MLVVCKKRLRRYNNFKMERVLLLHEKKFRKIRKQRFKLYIININANCAINNETNLLCYFTYKCLGYTHNVPKVGLKFSLANEAVGGY